MPDASRERSTDEAIDALAREVRLLRTRVDGIEARLRISEAGRKQEAGSGKPDGEPVPAPDSPRPAPAERRESLEARVGSDWLAKAGVAALVLGVAFFVKYAIDNDWIGLTARIVLGVLGGILLVAAADLLRSRSPRYRNWAEVVAGGGFALTYFCLWAAYAFEEYRAIFGLTITTDGLLLAAAALAAAAYAALRDARGLAAEAFVLGYLTSFLSKDVPTLALVYTLVLSVALLTVAFRRSWTLLGEGALVASYVYVAFLVSQEVDGLLLLAATTSYYLTFLAASLGRGGTDATAARFRIVAGLGFLVVGTLAAEVKGTLDD
ncbi:MAG: DUF2339 domain-containing protein, partial [Methanobacteriota archaeon]